MNSKYEIRDKIEIPGISFSRSTSERHGGYCCFGQDKICIRSRLPFRILYPGANMARVKAMFFLPREDNDGQSLEEAIKELEMELTFTFSGWTCAGYVAGHYRMADGTGASDVNSSYFVVLEESRLEELTELLKNFMDGTTQEAIYLEIHRNVEFRFITKE